MYNLADEKQAYIIVPIQCIAGFRHRYFPANHLFKNGYFAEKVSLQTIKCLTSGIF